MPIFEDEIPVSGSLNPYYSPKPVLGSPKTTELNTQLYFGADSGIPTIGGGLTLDEFDNLTSVSNKADFDSPFQMVPKSELLENKRYAFYERDKDLENIYGLHQSGWSQLGNGLVKMGATAVGTFAQGFATLPNTISAIKNGSLSELSGTTTGYESDIDLWLKNIEDSFPNYYTRVEKESPFLAAIPGFSGSANFWGDKIIKNIGFTVGAISSALVQDAAIALVTEGVGEIPLVASQIGKASLWLNKLFTGTNDLEKVLDLAKVAGATQKELLTIEKLGQLAANTRTVNSGRYMLNLYGSARTEAAIEARDGYRQVKEELLRQYSLDNLGAEPTIEEMTEIENYSTNAMNTRFGINMALLTVSNALQFDNLLKPFSAGGINSSLSKQIAEAGKIGLKKGSLDVFEKKVATTLPGRIWDSVKPKLGNVVTEGVYEEGGQYAAERGVYDYYTRKYKNPNRKENIESWNTLNEVLDSTTKGLAEQFNTTEGVENMLIGAISAIITGGLMGKVDSVKGRGSEAKLQASINSLNKYGLTGILQDKYGDTVDAIGIVKDMNEAVASNNIFKYKNLQHDMFFNFVNSRIPSGMHDVTIEQLKMLKELEPDQFKTMFGIDKDVTASVVNTYVDSLIEEANSIKATVDALDKTFKNPFQQTINPKNEQEAIEAFKFNTFNKWKTDLAYYSSGTTDINQRLNSIENNLLLINPLISSSVVADLTNKKTLLELSANYEEMANRLNSTISENTSFEDKKLLKQQIKSLRTLSERINLSLNTPDLKTFYDILNFEMNNREMKDPIIGFENVTDIYNYGIDINNLNLKKKEAADIFNYLSSEEGFDNYFKQAEDIEAEDVPLDDEFIPKFTNKEKQKEPLEIGREYELTAPKKAYVKKLAEDRWQVIQPDGSKTFFKTRELAQQEANEVIDENTNLVKIKILAFNEDGTVKVEDVNGDIFNISIKRLTGYTKLQSEQEKLQKNAEQIKKQQGDIKTPSVPTVDSETVQFIEEDPKKDAEILYISSITESEDWNDPSQSSPHIKRSREFLNNVKNFKNRGNIKAILVTPNQEDILGLTGLTNLSYGENDQSDARDSNIGFVAQVFVIQEKGGTYFVDVNGNKLSKIGEQVDLDKIIFQTMPTTSLVTSKGTPRYRANQKEDAEAQSAGWAAYRKGLFESTDIPTPMSFTISRGLPIIIDNTDRNHIGGILVPEKDIVSQEGLIIIPTTGTVAHNGVLIQFPNGVPILQYKDVVQPLKNRKFNKNEATALYEVIKLLTEDIRRQSIAGEDIRFNSDYAEFLQSVLYWKIGQTVSNNQIRFNELTLTFEIGDKSYNLDVIPNSKDEIISSLMEGWLSVNNKILTNDFKKPFIEYYIDGNTLATRKWKNYQSYLLLSSFPDGKSRSPIDTPLTTNVSLPTESVPYSFKQKYSILEGVELPVIEVPKKVVTSTIPTSAIYQLAPGPDGKERPVVYTSSTNAVGEIEVDVVPNETTKGIVENETTVNTVIVPILKQAGLFKPESTAEFNVLKYLALRISADLQKETKPTPVTVVKKTPPKNITPSDNYRRTSEGVIDRMTEEDLEIFQQWHSENVPNIPYEVLENMVITYDGEKAWGVFENGVAKFVKGGLRGTEYHEIFEGIWKGLLSSEEQQALLDEFKNTKGFFIDRQTKKEIPYNNATDLQAKERIADDFADFRIGKLPARNLAERILSFFKRIIEFFKSFVSNPSLKTSLFKAINTGKFKETIPNVPFNSFSEYRAVEGLTETETHYFVQDMTARSAGILFSEGRKDLLFSPEAITSQEMFARIEAKYAQEGRLDLISDKAWKELKQKTKDTLRTLGIGFDDQDRIDINTEEVNKNDYAPEPFSINWKKNSTGAIKFSLATLLLAQATNQENNFSLELPRPSLSEFEKEGSNVKGYQLLNFSRAFATVLDKLSNTTSVDKAMKKLLNLAEYDPNYVRLFQRVGGNLTTKTIPFENFDSTDWRYFVQFMQTFTKQKPDALIQYKTEVGEVHTGAANLFTAIRETKNSWIEGMKALAKVPNQLITLNTNTKTYKIDEKKLAEVKIKTPKQMVEFLNALAIDFSLSNYKSLKKTQANDFAKAVSAIYAHVLESNDLMTLTGKTISINTQLTTLSELYNRIVNPNQDSTYFGEEGQRVGSFAENNAPSLFENVFNESDTLEELKNNFPQLNDVFSTNSQILKLGGLYFDENGKRIRSLKVSVIRGTKLTDLNKGTSTPSLTRGDRFTQEINQNVHGRYYILIPADGSTEWMMDLGNNITFQEVDRNRAWSRINKSFRGYLLDDVLLALDSSNRERLKNIGAKGKELRFFKEILTGDVLKGINNKIEAGESYENIVKYIDENITDINKDVKTYISENVEDTKEILMSNSQINMIDEDVFTYPGLDDSFVKVQKLNKYKMTGAQIDNMLLFANVNYIMNNIEYHKVLFGDPYQFAVKEDGSLDETKRIKSFLSPRRTTFDTPEYNTFLNEQMNAVGDGIQLKLGDPGYQEFKSYTNTITVADDKIVGSLVSFMSEYENINVADAASWLMDGTYREIKLKNGQWSDEAEAWHQWQMSWTRQNMPGYKYTSTVLEAHDKEVISKKAPKYVIEVLKPIVTGNKYNKNQFDIVLDKFSQMPIYYSMVKGTTMENFYIQMFNAGVGYAIMESGRKVGIEQLRPLYLPNGELNTDSFTNLIQVPWTAYGIQVETTMNSNEKTQTRGSQLTKISSIDLFENGIATSPQAQVEYDRNINILNEMHAHAYNTLLGKLGVEDVGDRFIMADGKAVSETLMYEMMRRELSDNAKDTIQVDEENQFLIPFEASPSYLQIRNILYAMVNKALISPTMHGGSHVQVPVTMFEKATKGRQVLIKTAKGYEELTKEQYAALTEVQKKKTFLTDKTLKFYTKEEPWCEIMLPHWFKGKFNSKKFPTDESILTYLNSTEEGRNILKGVGFRIPTQSLSSSEVFKVKGFLPQYMGATVVVPAEITMKAGSDFDIDKLNMYLKAVYIDENDNVRLIKYHGSDTKQFYSTVFNNTIQKEIDRIFKYSEFREKLYMLFDDFERVDYNFPKEQTAFYLQNQILVDHIIEQADEAEILPSEYILRQIESIAGKGAELDAKLLSDVLRNQFIDDHYKKALENEYYDSLEKLLTLPENFKHLVTPVGDAGLKALASKINTLKGYDETKIKNRILDRNYMTSLRQSFSMAKKWVGIAAVNITNLSLKQKSQIYIDPEMFSKIPKEDLKFLGDGSVILKHNTVSVNGESFISLSGTTVKDSDELISNRYSGYATSFVDVAKDDYITSIIESNLVIGTFMFLENIGAGEQTAYFLNQPIISEYLKMLDGINSKSLFSINNIKHAFDKFPTTGDLLETIRIDINNFESNIKDYYSGELSAPRNAEQHHIFMEFLKYAKMAEYNFKFTQATNYDTTRFGSGEEFTKKQWRTIQANSANIISSASKVMDSTFIGEQEFFISKSMQAMGSIFKLEEDDFRVITNSVLKPYGLNVYLSADDFGKIANQIKAAFLDYIIQTKTGLNDRIKELLVDENSVASRLIQAKKDFPNIRLLRDLEVVSSPIPGGAMSVKLNVNLKEAYDENLYTGMMRELRDSELNQLYKDLVSLSILQGVYSSAISIRNIIPIEDYSDIVAPIIRPLVADGELMAFTQGMFQRNNFKDDAIVPSFSPRFWPARDQFGEEQPPEIDQYDNEIYTYNSPMFPSIEQFGIKPTNRRVLVLSEKWNSFQLKNEFLKVPRVVRSGWDNVDMVTGKTITGIQFVQKRLKGDRSFYDVFGYKKVLLASGEPLTYEKVTKGQVETMHVYKLINLYGDGQYAKENYPDFKMSVLNNGTIKIDNEIPDNDLIEFYAGKTAPIATPVQEPAPEITTRQITVEQFNISIHPDGRMFYQNGNELTDQTTINKVNVRKELQDGTLRVAVYNNSNYFVLSDNRIVGSGKTNLGKETISDPKIKEMILAKAIIYKKEC